MKKMVKKVLCFVLAIATATGCFAMLAGCNGAKGNELIVFTMFGGDDALVPKYEIGKKQFADANPEVTIIDQSIQAMGEGFDDVAVSKFVNDKYAPDVMYIFSPGRNLALQPKLAKVADIRKEFPDYGKGFPEVGGDPTALAFLGNSFGMYYEKSKFAATDFASYTSLRTKLKSFTYNELVDATSEMNSWFNYIGLQKMGKKWADVAVPDKAWLTANKTDIAAVIDEMVAYCKTDLKMGPNTDYGKQKETMWNGNKVFDINGNWNAAGFYAPHSTAGKADNYDFRTLAVDDNAATADIDESKYVMSGFFHGWMISKKCYEDKDKLKLAVEFINKQCDNVLEYGGMAANGAVGGTDTTLAKATKAVLKLEGAIMCSPLDDKWLFAPAKKEFYDGLKDIMLGTGITSTQIVDNAIKAFI